jgi:F-type H+-transporting ATPase subunit alpha
MKQVAGPLRLSLAQFRELQAFAQFGTDLDEDTTRRIERGKRLTEILKQPQYKPFPEVFQVISIVLATSGLLDDVAVEKVRDFEERFIEHIRINNTALTSRFSTGQKIDDDMKNALTAAVTEFKKGFN